MNPVSPDDIQKLLKSGRFDSDWYINTYPDVAALPMEPAAHYLWIGEKLGRKPGPSSNAMSTPNHRLTSKQTPIAEGKPVARTRGQTLSRLEGHTRAAGKGEFDARSYILCNPDVGETPDSARAHWEIHGQSEGRAGSGVSAFSRRRAGSTRTLSQRPKVCIYAPTSSKSGLGTAARGYVEMLRGLDLEIEVIDSSAALYPERKGSISMPTQKPDITIIHQNADAIGNIFRFVDRSILDDTYVIGIWVCELTAFDSRWRDMFAAVDEVWTPSSFCAEAISTIAPAGYPIRVVPHLVPSPDPTIQENRSVFGIPSDAFTFLYSFDVSSSVERKNPEACLKAFCEAFGRDMSAFLVVKFHSTKAAHDLVHALRQKYSAPNILFLDLLLSDEQLEVLKRSVDCFVSPHRAEGFGLNIAEMMALGTPVIASAYSGNMDYCRENNSVLISCSLTEVTQQAGPYRRGAVWASPNHDALVDAMRDLQKSPDFGRKIGATAQSDISDRFGLLEMTKYAQDVMSSIVENWNQLNRITREQQSARQHLVWRHPAALTTRTFDNQDLPLISVIVPVYNISPDLLRECIDSVLLQTYPFWELCLCDDSSTRTDTLEYLETIRGSDQRIRVRQLKKNAGIAGATNAAVEMATGEYLAFLDNDDTLNTEALEKYAKAIVENPSCDLLYCDEDKIDTEGRYVDHYFKPDWSPEHLESCMYILHMLCVRKQLFLDLNGYRHEFDGAQDYDLALRVARQGGQIIHIPEVLYHWRMIPGSAATEVDAKPTALVNARRALEDYAYNRYGPDAKVTDGLYPGLFRIQRGLFVQPPVTLIILTNSISRDVSGRGQINLTENFLNSIYSKTSYPNFKVIVASDGELTEKCRTLLAERGDKEIIYKRPGPNFNFADKANFSVDKSDTDFVVLLNDDMEIRNEGWLNALIDQLVKEDVGVVGAHLSYPDNRIQHVGMVMGVNETTAHIYHGHKDDAGTYNSYASVIRNYSAVTGACLATKRSIFEIVGGFDTEFATDFNDTDYCLKVGELGYRIVYTPFSRLYHFENQSFERKSQNENEKNLFLTRWESVIRNDPFYNPNLRRDSLIFEPFASRWPSLV